MRKGWFKIPGKQDGDRTIEQQMQGLNHLLPLVQGKRVLDFGCAEGLIAGELCKAGASFVCGMEIVPEHVAVANTVNEDRFFAHCCNLNDEGLTRSLTANAGPDIVLMLAILHKLRRPLWLVEHAIDLGPDLIVIRTAARTPGYVQDERSNMKRYDFMPLLEKAGYAIYRETKGPLNEWMGYFGAKE